MSERNLALKRLTDHFLFNAQQGGPRVNFSKDVQGEQDRLYTEYSKALLSDPPPEPPGGTRYTWPASPSMQDVVRTLLGVGVV